MSLPQEFLQSIFMYDPLTGHLTWKDSRSNMIKGSLAGCVNKAGYMVVTINSKTYRVQRIIWLWMFGSIPANFYIDHINGNKLDNRLTNLRLATNKQNQENRAAPKNSSSGLRGVGWHKNYGKWMARISHNNQRKTIGFFDTKEQAWQAYKAEAAKLYTHTDRLP